MTSVSTLRAMTYNIRHGLGNHPESPGVFGDLDLDRIASIIIGQAPDIVGLQEVDRAMERSRHVDQANWLAEATGMHACFGANLIKGSEEYGVAILSRHPIIDSTNFPIETPEGWEPRGILSAIIDVPGFGKVAAFNTHLQYGPPAGEEEAVRQRTTGARQALECLAAAEYPAILFGDFNAQPGDLELADLENLQDAWLVGGPGGNGYAIPACPIREPEKRIDMIYIDDRWHASGCEVVVSPVTRLASDHFPVVTNLTLRDS